MLKWLILVYYHCIGFKLVEYRFSVNFGQTFLDYSGNLQVGVNGSSSLDILDDGIPTDRGIYLQGSANRITLPPNDQIVSNIVLPSTYSVIIWAFSIGGNSILFQRKLSATAYLYIGLNPIYHPEFRIVDGVYDTGRRSTILIQKSN
jgi:hypothetical protein